MGKLLPLKTNRTRKLGETVFTDSGLRLPPIARAPKEWWFIAALAMMSVGVFLTVLFW